MIDPRISSGPNRLVTVVRSGRTPSPFEPNVCQSKHLARSMTFRPRWLEAVCIGPERNKCFFAAG